MDLIERNKKVEENLALVTFSLQKLGIAFNEDYFQQGVLELIRCVECFNENRGRKFSTYAVKNITFKLKEYIIRDKVLKPKRTQIKGRVYAPICDSFEKVVYNESGEREILLGDMIEDTVTSNMDLLDLQIDIDMLIEKGIITERDYNIFKRVAMGYDTESKIAKEMKLSRAQISKIVCNVREKLKTNLSYNNY